MMTAALVLLATLPAVEPAEVHDVLLEVAGKPALRLRLRIELDGRSLATLDADAKRDREGLKDKAGASALDRLMPDGSLLRAEAMLAEAPHPAALSHAIFKALDKNGDDKLSPDELADAEKSLLARFDLDGDDCITALELVPDLQTVVPDKRPSVGAVRVTVVPVEGEADLERTVKLGRTATHWRGTVGGVPLEIHGRPPLPGEKPAMPKALLADNRAEVKAAFERTARGIVSLTAVPGPVGRSTCSTPTATGN
jgi:hypothetical protein